MALIKSALELALEKTEGLSVDKEELRKKEVIVKGRVAANQGLDQGAEVLSMALKTQEKELPQNELPFFLQGASDNLLTKVSVTADPLVLNSLPRLADLLDVLTKKKAGPVVQKISSLLAQFQQEFQQLKDAIGKQLGPALRQRAQQSGANPATYIMERDPAYLKVLGENLDPMKTEYQKALDDLKDEIRSYL